MVMQQQRLQGVTVGSVEDLQAMCDAIAVNKMKPVIDKTFPFDQAAEAFRYMASGAHFGKVATRSDDGENWTLSGYPVSTDEATATIKLEKSRNIVGWRRK
jgi:hypothetical protein